MTFFKPLKEFVLLIFLLISTLAFSQTIEDNNRIYPEISRANQLYLVENYQAAANSYSTLIPKLINSLTPDGIYTEVFINHIFQSLYYQLNCYININDNKAAGEVYQTLKDFTLAPAFQQYESRWSSFFLATFEYQEYFCQTQTQDQCHSFLLDLVKICEKFVDEYEPGNQFSSDQLSTYLQLQVVLASFYKENHREEGAKSVYKTVKEIIESNQLENESMFEMYYQIAVSSLTLIEQEATNYQAALQQSEQIGDINMQMYGSLSDEFLNTKFLEISQMQIAEMRYTARKEATAIIHQIEQEGKTQNPYYQSFITLIYSINMSLGDFEECLLLLDNLTFDQTSDYKLTKADLFFLDGKYQAAVELYESVFAHSELEEKDQYFQHIASYASCLYEIGDYDSFLTIMKKYSHHMRDVATDQLRLSSINYQLGSAYYSVHNFKKAEELFKKALSDLDHTDGNDEIRSYYASSLGLCYLVNNKFEDADEAMSTALKATEQSIFNAMLYFTEQNRLHYLDQINPYKHNIYYYTATRHKDHPSSTALSYDYTLLIKELGLNSITTIRKNASVSQDQQYKTLLQKWLSTNELLKDVNTRLNKDSLQDYASAYERELIDKGKADILVASQKQEINWQSIQNSLSAHEAAIEFISFKPFPMDDSTSLQYAALLIRKDKKYPLYIDLFEETKLKTLFNAAANTTDEEKAHILYTEQGKILSDLIWQPFEKYLDGIKKVFYAPTGLLHAISFSALPYDTNSNFLSDEYQLVRLNNTKYLTKEFKEESIETASLFGGMNYSTDNFNSLNSYASRQDQNTERYQSGLFQNLPGTKDEITQISEQLKHYQISSHIYMEENADEENFLSDVQNARDILHISTHAFFLEEVKEDEFFATDLYGMGIQKMNEDPMNRAGIVFSGANFFWEKGESFNQKEDGILTANEIASLDLSSTKLVVLSACETGIGDNTMSDGIFGLQRAFKLAGVEHLILSLWKVDDKVTKEFMVSFYDELFESKLTIEEAMEAARIKVKKKYPSPYYWAAFDYIR
ncbi:CHAT domain-containing protein [Catalinimonas sp. 4WD22]|uniref:CHAT domain-containing protein n=1 Tax=Catalinimonas locisalis TaxID=3133978 RepID=UPI0031011338